MNTEIPLLGLTIHKDKLGQCISFSSENGCGKCIFIEMPSIECMHKNKCFQLERSDLTNVIYLIINGIIL